MKQTIIISLVVALVFFTLGYLIGSAKISPTGQLAIGANTYQAGWEAAKKRLADSGFGLPMADFEINNVSGQVTAVKGDAITLKIMPLELLADPNLDERIIKVDANTKIYVLEQKDQAEYQKEMEDFDKKMQEQINNMPAPGEIPASPVDAITPPGFFVKKEISISGIKVGDNISVIAADNDIKNTKQFTAAEINLQQAPAMTPPAADQPVE
ncbi:MAG: hypothetical protein ABIB72_02555 [Candidatus Falkowbacteria bacterium]